MKEKAATISQIGDGKGFCTVISGQKIVLARKNGQIYAIENKCPHFGLPLGKGKIEDGQIACPFHGSRFDVETGENTDWLTSLGGVLPIPNWLKPEVSCCRASEQEE